MKIINKIGKLAKIQSILCDSGFHIKYQTLAQQIWRKNLSKEVSLILWDYCQKNNIPVSLEDFRG